MLISLIFTLDGFIIMKRNKKLILLGAVLITCVISGAGIAYAQRTTNFELKGELPAQIQLNLKVKYEPREGSNECVISKKIKRYDMYLHPEIARQEKDSIYQLKIPTFLRVKGCYLPIRSINIAAIGKYGEYVSYGEKYNKEDTEQFAASIGFYNARDEKLLNKQPTKYRSLCQWYFRIMPEGLVKILTCKAPDEEWKLPEDEFKQGKLRLDLARNNLAGQIFTVDFRLNPNETPYFKGSWEKTSTGWRPCLGKGDNKLIGFCDLAPGKYKKFEMDGKTCTVYPNCTE